MNISKRLIYFLFFITLILYGEITILKYYYYEYYISIINSDIKQLIGISIFIINLNVAVLLIIILLKRKLINKNNRYYKSIYWLKRIRLYVSLLIFTFLIFHLLFIKFNFSQTNPDSARYLLSTVIQSQAALIAIVVSLTLLAVQLAAASYSRRVIDVFKNNPDFWIVLILYGFSITFSLIVLKQIEKNETGYSNLEIFIKVSIYLAIYTFLILFPYFSNTFNILKPSAIIKELMKEIKKKYILGCGGKYDRRQDDPFYPIIDLFKDSLIKRDFDITRELLANIESKALELISPEANETILN